VSCGLRVLPRDAERYIDHIDHIDHLVIHHRPPPRPCHTRRGVRRVDAGDAVREEPRLPEILKNSVS